MLQSLARRIVQHVLLSKLIRQSASRCSGLHVPCVHLGMVTTTQASAVWNPSLEACIPMLDHIYCDFSYVGV